MDRRLMSLRLVVCVATIFPGGWSPLSGQEPPAEEPVSVIDDLAPAAEGPVAVGEAPAMVTAAPAALAEVPAIHLEEPPASPEASIEVAKPQIQESAGAATGAPPLPPSPISVLAREFAIRQVQPGITPIHPTPCAQFVSPCPERQSSHLLKEAQLLEVAIAEAPRIAEIDEHSSELEEHRLPLEWILLSGGSAGEKTAAEAAEEKVSAMGGCWVPCTLVGTR